MPLKVMIVDDDRTTLEVTAAILEEQGHHVVQQDTALGTSMLILREKPDVVLLDIRMPGLSGDRLAALITARTSGGRAPVIILHSSLGAAELRDLVAKTGAAGFIEKTPSPAAFTARFDRVLAAASSTSKGHP